METDIDRMRDALLMLAHNLDPGGYDMRPISYDFSCKCADFARKVANGESVPEFDESRVSTELQEKS